MELFFIFTLLIGGLFLILSALYVEARHVEIWESYKKTYKKPKNAFKARLAQPNKLVYQFNVYILWPLAFVTGCIAVFTALRAIVS